MLEPTCMFSSVALLTELQTQPPFRGRKYEMTSQSSLCDSNNGPIITLNLTILTTLTTKKNAAILNLGKN